MGILPSEVNRILRGHARKCRHQGLVLDKFAPWDYYSNNNRMKRDVLWTVAPDAALMQAQRSRWERMIKDQGGRILKMRTKSRLMVGFGATHVLETALTLDHNSGLPVVPGSAVKGLTRAYSLYDLAPKLGIGLLPPEELLKRKAREKEEKRPFPSPLAKLDSAIGEFKLDAEDIDREVERFIEAVVEDEPNAADLGDAIRQGLHGDAWGRFVTFCQVFGTKYQAGMVNFHQGVYAGQNAPQYGVDVMTPHFGKYYNMEGFPSDDLVPVPIPFLAVAKDSDFWFGLTPRSGLPDNVDPVALMDDAAKCLRGALIELGAGGKTSAGYGFFVSVKNQQR